MVIFKLTIVPTMGFGLCPTSMGVETIYESACALLKHIRLTECRTFLDWSEETEAIKLVASSAPIAPA